MHINSLYLNTSFETTFSIINYYIRSHFPKPANTIAKDSLVPSHATEASDLRLPLDHSSSNVEGVPMCTSYKLNENKGQFARIRD